MTSSPRSIIVCTSRNYAINSRGSFTGRGIFGWGSMQPNLRFLTFTLSCAAQDRPHLMIKLVPFEANESQPKGGRVDTGRLPLDPATMVSRVQQGRTEFHPKCRGTCRDWYAAST